MLGLLFYDPSTRTGEFYKTNVLGEIALLKQHTNWRTSWTQIIPGHFGGGGTGSTSSEDLLFYDAAAGIGEFYTTDGKGGISLLRQQTGWRTSWTHIIPSQFGGGAGSSTDLLFYDASAGVGQFYTTNGQGGISLMREYNNWRTSWKLIIPGEFGGGGSSFRDLLFYDAAAGTGEFYSTDGRGGIALLRQHTGWRSSWTHIVPGQFGGNGFTDLLFYEAATGVAEFYTTDGQGGITLLRAHTGWPTNLKQIIPGDFGGNGFTDLLFYAGATGQFYTTNGQGGIRLLREHTDWRTSWAQIISGNFSSSSFNNLLAPSGLQVTGVADRQISVSWLYQASTETGFRVRFRGKRAGFSDHTGTKSVNNFEKSTNITGLRSGYEYTISVVAFNAAGESPRSNEVRATTPARTISVTKEGVGTTAIFIVTGTGFTPGNVVVIRATDPQFNQVQFVETAGVDGKFVGRQSIPCQSGLQITFTAFEDADPAATFANSIITTCP